MTEYWTPTRNEKFRTALMNAFDEQSFDLLLQDYFGLKFPALASPGYGVSLEFRMQVVIRQARSEDWVLDLVGAARERRPKNPQLAALANELGMTISGARLINKTPATLEALVNSNSKFIKMAAFLENLGILQGQVCWIKMPKGGGTGFLVGPDLVLTNYHVMSPVIEQKISAADVICQFDYLEPIDGPKITTKKLTEVKLHPEGWKIDTQPTSDFDSDNDLGEPATDESDFALIRLLEAIGDSPVGGTTLDTEAPKRSWISIPPNVPPIAAGTVLFLLQHPLGEPLQLAVGSVSKFNSAGTRVRYDASSKKGSSGSPCFDSDLQLVALHNGRDVNDPPSWNQAIPFGLIRKFRSLRSLSNRNSWTQWR